MQPKNEINLHIKGKKIKTLHKERDDVKNTMEVLDLKKTLIEIKGSTDGLNKRMEKTQEIMNMKTEQ